MARKRKRRSEPSEGLWGSLLFRFGSRLFLGLAVIVAFLTLAQCTIKKPESPQWNTRLTVPVMNRTYAMEELIRKIDQDGLAIDSSGMVTYSVTKDFDTVQLEEDLLRTPDLSYEASERVGAVTLDPPDLDPVMVSLSSISGLASGLPGDSANVIETSFDLYNDMPTITSFSQATVSDGQAVVVVDNGLGVNLDTVIVEIFDVSNGWTIATGAFPAPIESGHIDSLPLSLDGKTISDALEIISHCHTPGGLVDSVSSRYVSTELVFAGGLEVTSAVAEVPALSREFSQQVALNEGHRIDTANLSGGSLDLTVANGTNLDANVTVTIPDFVSSGSQPLTIDQPAPARQNTVIAVDLSGYRLIPGEVTFPQEIDINVIASAPGTAPQQVQVDQSDSFFVEAALISMTFSSVTGVFDTLAASFEGLGQEIDVPAGFDSIQFVSVILTLEIENGIDMPGSLGVWLHGDNGKSLNLPGNIAASGGDGTSLTIISDSSVADFLSPPPSHIDLSGSVTFGDGTYQGTIEADDFVTARVKILAPLEIVVNKSCIETDIEREEIDQEDIDIITDHVIEGWFIYNIINHLPLGAYVNVYFGSDSATLYSGPIKTFDSLLVTEAPVSADGIVSDTASTGYQEVYLDGADVRRILENHTLYVGQQLMLEGSDGQSVKLTQDDYITVVGRIEVEYRFDGNF